jgi:acyl-CoA thioesterase FadM
VRTLTTVLTASLRPACSPQDALVRRFRVMPWDVGISVFRSDRYFAVAEAAQFDFLVRTRLMLPMLRAGVHWVNLAQSSRLQRPLRLLQAFDVHTRVACMDERHAYFAHEFRTAAGPHARVLVKAKLKRGSITVPPATWFGVQAGERSAEVDALDALG